MFQDRTLQCKECGQRFVFTAREQEFFAEKGFQNDPSRCPSCRAERRRTRGTAVRSPRQFYSVVCSECGVQTEVPFKPSEDRPVYCQDCFQKARRR